MDPLLNDFKAELRTRLLDFLWRQWSALGVAGSAGAADNRIIDPEALLLFTCTLGRHDARLFDEVLDWLHAHGWLVNIMRLKRVMQTEQFAGGQTLTAIASLLAKGAEAPKWRQLAAPVKSKAEPVELFFDSEGRSLPVFGELEDHFARHGLKRGPLRLRGYSTGFNPIGEGTLTLQLRALFGITARCEIIAYLLTHETAHPSQIARDTYHFERGLQATLVDMSQSGSVQIRAAAREKHYWLRPERWWDLLEREAKPFPQWMTWPPLLRAWEIIWLRLGDAELETLEPSLQSSELRRLMSEVRPLFARSGVDRLLSDERQFPGEAYRSVFVADLHRLLGASM